MSGGLVLVLCVFGFALFDFLRCALVHCGRGRFCFSTPIDYFCETVAITRLETVGEYFGLLCSVIALGISIPAYNIARGRRFLEMTDNTIDDVLAIYVGSRAVNVFSSSCLLFLC